jgi:hypothetical protein
MTNRIWQGLGLAIGTSVLLPALALAQDPSHAAEYGVPIVITGMAGGIIFVLAIIAMSFAIAVRQNKQRLEVIERLIDKGQPVPRELFGKAPLPLPAHIQQRVDLRRGIALLGWAIGIALLMYFGFGQLRAAAWGLLFLFLSVASFVNAYLSSRHARERADA